jgi:SAM-dependent methyltransferase
MDAEEAAVRAYYERGEERDRLSDGRGQLEFIRTTGILARRLPSPPAVIADIGGGPGRYALWLASLGYQVEHRDLMPLHVSQLQADAAEAPGIRAAIGDARQLDLSDASADAVLLLGPLYHLASRTGRAAAIGEAALILRPGGPLFAAAISRWATRIDGIIADRVYLKYPAALGHDDGLLALSLDCRCIA